MGMGGETNKSGTKGEAQILNENGNKRVQMIARNVVETGFIELFEHMVNLNLKYIESEEVMRLLNKDLTKDPSTFSQKYDVTVSMGLGLGSSEQNMRAMQFVSTYFQELMPLMQLFTANPNLYTKHRAQKAKILEEMGVKDVDTYLPTQEEMFPRQQQIPPQMGGRPPLTGGPQMPQMPNRRMM
jgi:hypothetical protein